MKNYEVTVMSAVKEIYFVEAENEDEARGKWSNNEPFFSEAIETELHSVMETQP